MGNYGENAPLDSPGLNASHVNNISHQQIAVEMTAVTGKCWPCNIASSGPIVWWAPVLETSSLFSYLLLSLLLLVICRLFAILWNICGQMKFQLYFDIIDSILVPDCCSTDASHSHRILLSIFGGNGVPSKTRGKTSIKNRASVDDVPLAVWLLEVPIGVQNCGI